MADKIEKEIDADGIIADAMEFLRLSADADSHNRSEGLMDLKFVNGEQWPAELQNSRQLEARPCLTINKLDGFCRQVSNQQRQQRPRIKVHPTNSFATKKIADVITGLCRHVEVNSDADSAYDTAFDYAVKIGWGYFRIITKYIREDSFDQDIYLEPIDNPFTVYFDPNSVAPDGQDAMKCLVTDVMSRDMFKRIYPHADDGSSFLTRGTGDDTSDWITKEDVRVAEFFRVEFVKAKLLMLSDKNCVWKDEYEKNKDVLDANQIEVIGERDSFKRKVMWYKVTAMEVLESREWPGRWIPIIPVYGNISVIEGKRRKFGMVRFAKDPQRMINYWTTSATESIALAPKAKWVIAEGQDEGHENEWARANQSALPVLRYKQTDIDGQPAPPPQRLQPEPPPVGILQALDNATNNMREVLGVNDPAMRVMGNVSGKALNAERMQSDNSTFHYYDNLTRSISFAGKQLLDLFPKIYDQERETRIIGDDGQPEMITVNKRITTPEGEIIENNLSVGQYDVVMDTGPGYNSKRIEAVDAMTPLMANPEMMKTIGDLYFRNSDFPGSEVIADRLAALNPLAKIDDKSQVPPQAQMMIAQLQQQLQAASQQMQAMQEEIKSRAQLEQMKQEYETKREMMKATVKAHDTESWVAEERNQVESVERTRMREAEIKALSAQHTEEIKGMIQLLLAKMDQSSINKLEKSADEEHEETSKEFQLINNLPLKNEYGHNLHRDKYGNHAYIGPNGEVTEVENGI